MDPVPRYLATADGRGRLRSAMTSGSSLSVRAHLHDFATRGVISRYGVPERIVLVDELPKTSVGKLDKKILRDKYPG